MKKYKMDPYDDSKDIELEDKDFLIIDALNRLSENIRRLVNKK